MDRFDLGSHTRTISTVSPKTQRWFNLGLNWCFAFNKSEGVKCFRKALEFDAECVMAHWGIAYGCGPFYNMTWRDHSEEEVNSATRIAYEHIQMARALTNKATKLENWLVETLACRVQKSHCVQPEEFRNKKSSITAPTAYWRWPRRCWMANWNTTKVVMNLVMLTCGKPSIETTIWNTSSRGPGCIHLGMRSRHCWLSRAITVRLRRSVATTWA